MLATMKQVDQQNELDALANIPMLARAVAICKEPSASKSAGTNGLCIELNYKKLSRSSHAETRDQRLDKLVLNLKKKVQSFQRNHLVAVRESEMINVSGGRLSANDLQTAQVYYVENLPFRRPNLLQKVLGKTEPVRQYGADLHNEYVSNKNIHELLVRGLENVCKDNRPGASKIVVLHNAYFFPSPNVMQAFGKMMNGAWDCKGVTVAILTNSYETTDLFPVNAVASTQFKAMFDINAEEIRKGNKRSAQFRLLEYKKQSQGDDRSLHSKVSLIGNDIMIGSANLDMRSYAMDTNNGVYITGASDLAADYRRFIDSLIRGELKDERGQPKFVIHDRTQDMLVAKSKDQFIDEQLAVIKYAVSQYKSGSRILGDQAKPETQAKYTELLRSMMSFVYSVTVGGLDSSRIMPSNMNDGVTPAALEKFQQNQQRKLERMVQDMLSTI
jgi:PLD-like domain